LIQWNFLLLLFIIIALFFLIIFIIYNQLFNDLSILLYCHLCVIHIHYTYVCLYSLYFI
jgi:hypothetical protein